MLLTRPLYPLPISQLASVLEQEQEDRLSDAPTPTPTPLHTDTLLSNALKEIDATITRADFFRLLKDKELYNQYSNSLLSYMNRKECLEKEIERCINQKEALLKTLEESESESDQTNIMHCIYHCCKKEDVFLRKWTLIKEAITLCKDSELTPI